MIPGRRHFETVVVSPRKVVEFPPYGYLDGFEVKLKELAPNMDASARYRAIVEVIGPDGHPLEFEVVACFRDSVPE